MIKKLNDDVVVAWLEMSEYVTLQSNSLKSLMHEVTLGSFEYSVDRVDSDYVCSIRSFDSCLINFENNSLF